MATLLTSCAQVVDKQAGMEQNLLQPPMPVDRNKAHNSYVQVNETRTGTLLKQCKAELLESRQVRPVT